MAVDEKDWPPIEQWAVVRNKYPCCGRGTRLDAHKFYGSTVTKTCPYCGRVWDITYRMSEWAEQLPFIVADFVLVSKPRKGVEDGTGTGDE